MKLKIFISSRNNDTLIFPGKMSLTDLRKSIKKKLEEIRFLDKEIFDVRINEDFASDTSENSYNTCLKEVVESDLIIVLYNGNAGWAPVGIDLGICHAEMDQALSISSKKTYVIDISKFSNVDAKGKGEKERNELFDKYLADLNIFRNPLKLPAGKQDNVGFEDELLSAIKLVIANHLDERIKISNLYFHIAGNNRISLNWKKLKYSDRNVQIRAILDGLLASNPDFKGFTFKAYSIPDNMSVEDAKSFTGRPFLIDQDIIDPPSSIQKHGPIHFIGVYGNATEIQVKSLIGYPDVSVIKEDFGIYVWEQNTHIQMVFLTEAKTPEAVKSKFLLFTNWIHSSGEFSNIEKRAKARYTIMSAINQAKAIIS